MKKLSLKELNRISNQEFKELPKTPIVVILDNIRSALNVGSVFRTSDAFAVEKMYLCGITAKPPHREILKTAIGATESVDWEHHKSTVKVIEQLKADDYIIVGIEQADESIMLQNFEVDTNKKYAIVLGNEVKGVSNEVMQVLDYCIEVPQLGTKHSLNVSVCTGVVIWDFFKKYKYS